MNLVFVDRVVEECIDIYNKLPKTGKPIDKEWTVLSCIVKVYNDIDIEVVSLGTGSKCIGSTKMCPKGLLLNDSHAEVMARRGFLLYLYDNIEKASEGATSIFQLNNGKYSLKKNVYFIFYSSQLPCGDASIIPKVADEQHFGEIIKTQKRIADSCICNISSKTSKLCNDIHRTGAKCLPESQQDPKHCGDGYHLLGQVRTKPGRGDRTLSVSCSDKMARWIQLGIQGSLLDMLLDEPIYIKYFIFGANTPYSEESLTRAFLIRNNDSKDLGIKLECVPKFYQSSVIFSNVRTLETLKPAPGSIVWINIDTPISEVAIMGKKLGATKRNKGLTSSCLCVCKYLLFKKFLIILNKNKCLRECYLAPEENVECLEYNYIKSKSIRYLKKWLSVKENFFRTWTTKPSMWNFSISNS